MTGVQSVERAMAILRAVGDEPGGLVDVAARTSLPTSTAARLLATLEREGGLRRDSSGVYRIGPDIVSMTKSTSGDDVAVLARPHMVGLAELLGEAVALSIPSGNSTTTVAQIDAPKPVRAEDWTGTVVPLHAGCVGLVTLAHLSDDEIDDYVTPPLARLTDQTVIDPVAIRNRLVQIRRGDLLWTHGEYVEGISSLAAPVFDDRGVAVAALYAYGPSYRFPDPSGSGPRSTTAVSTLVADVARAMSTELGWPVDPGPTNSSSRTPDARKGAAR